MHDKSGILVAFLTQGIELSNRVIESLLGEVAGLVGRVQDFVVEDGEVQSETETDGMCGSQVRGSNLGSLLVSLQGLVCRCFSLFLNGKFGKVSVVVALPETRVS